MKKVALKLSLALVLLTGMGNAFAAKPQFPMPCLSVFSFCGPSPKLDPKPRDWSVCVISGYNGRCIVPMPVLY